jgi:hypothetical protein
VSTLAPSDFLYQNGKQILAGLSYFAMKANTWNITLNRGNDILNFKIQAKEDYGNSSIVSLNYQEMIADPNINFLLGPVSAPLTAAAKAVTEPAGRLLLATKDGSSSFYTDADYSYSVTPSPPRYSTVIYPELRIKGIRRIILVVEQISDQIDISKGFVSNADDFLITVLRQYNVVTDVLDGIDNTFLQNISKTVELIRDAESELEGEGGVDAIIIASFTNVGRYFLEAARDIKYTPKAMFVTGFYLENRPHGLVLDY